MKHGEKAEVVEFDSNETLAWSLTNLSLRYLD